MTTRGRGFAYHEFGCAWRIKYWSMRFVVSASEITPSRNGRMATTEAGVRPTIFLAASPIARVFEESLSIATTVGSSMITPRPARATRVFAVPRSIPMS